MIDCVDNFCGDKSLYHMISRYLSIRSDYTNGGLYILLDWWVDFVYFTNLPFSMVHLYNDNGIQCSFYVESNIDQVPVLVSGAPLIISILASALLSGAI